MIFSLRPLMPPLALMYLKYASIARGISLYPGAAGPVSGKWPPTVTEVFVTPGADEPPPPPPDEPHAATPRTSATTAQAVPRGLVNSLMARSSPPSRAAAGRGIAVGCLGALVPGRRCARSGPAGRAGPRA